MNTSGPGERAKRVGFLELFFDLVFVFAVTQLVAVLYGDHSAGGWGRAAVLLWLVWWAWSQYAWAGNAIDLDRRLTRMWVLVSSGAMLAAAAALPEVFTSNRSAAIFGVLYTAVRLIGLGLYWTGLADDGAYRAALRTYLPIQLASPLLVLVGGMVPSGGRTWLWVAAILVDVASALAAGRGEFRIDPSHFAERHGLIVIIALGESVIVTGSSASAIGLSGSVATLLAIGFVMVAALWWCYFDWFHAEAEHRLVSEVDHRRRGRLARDLFTLGHLPIVAGTMVVAAAMKVALKHPGDELDGFGVAALTAGPALYLLGFVLGRVRAAGRVPVARAVGLVGVLVAGPVAGSSLPATAAVAAVTAVVLAVLVAERGLGSRTTADHD